MTTGTDIAWTEWDAQLAVAQLFRYRNGNTCIPSCTTFGWEMDVAVITPAHYLYEVEIKRTLSDWKADEGKDKWKRPRSEVSKFYYAIPPSLLDKKPGFVSDDTGIILLEPPEDQVKAAFRVYASVHKEAKRISKVKVDTKRPYMMGIFYYRYWGLRWDMGRTRKQPSQMALELGAPITDRGGGWREGLCSACGEEHGTIHCPQPDMIDDDNPSRDRDAADV